ncbi:MAG: NAD(P)-binding domain-containing protein, partial [Bacteroidales bacterium]|nr:NAD(P)-binding domain-containing protein [Bacteroidales bacterium]
MHSDQIGIVGAGNAGWHLATGLYQAGFEIRQIVSKTTQHARQLADRVGARYLDTPVALDPELGFLFLAIPDDAIIDVVNQLKDFKGVVLHISGSFPLSGLAGQSFEYGVFYPLQTFSKERPALWKEIPVFIEASSETVLGRIKT